MVGAGSGAGWLAAVRRTRGVETRVLGALGRDRNAVRRRQADDVRAAESAERARPEAHHLRGCVVGPIEQLAHELMQRELDRPALSRDWLAQPKAPRNEMKPLNPEVAALLGGAADAVSTYAFLRAGVGTEGNPMYRGLKQHPLKTGLAVGAAGLGYSALRNLLRKAGAEPLADILAVTQAAQSLSLSADNFGLLYVQYPGHVRRRMDERSSFAKTNERLRDGVTGMRNGGGG